MPSLQACARGWAIALGWTVVSTDSRSFRLRIPNARVISLVTGVVVALIATFVPLSTLADMVNIGTLFAFVLVSAGVIVLRRLEPDRHRPFRAPWVPFTPILAIVTCLYLMLQLPTLTWIRFGLWLLLGHEGSAHADPPIRESTSPPRGVTRHQHRGRAGGREPD